MVSQNKQLKWEMRVVNKSYREHRADDYSCRPKMDEPLTWEAWYKSFSLGSSADLDECKRLCQKDFNKKAAAGVWS